MLRALLGAEGAFPRAAAICSPRLWLHNYSRAGTSASMGLTECTQLFFESSGEGHRRQFCSSHPPVVSAIADESFPQAVIIPQDLIVTKNEEAMFDCQFEAVPPPHAGVAL